jgi:hypothetical protein
MTNEEFVRQAYAIAGTKHIAARVACFIVRPRDEEADTR